MKVTAKIISAGERWAIRTATVAVDNCGSVFGCFQELAKAENEPYVRGANADEPALCAVVCNWLALAQNWRDENHIGEDSAGYERTVERLNRKAAKGRVSFAVARWSFTRDGTIHCEITTDGGDVAQGKQYEVIYASMLAEAAKITLDNMAERGAKVDFGANAAALYGRLIDYRKRAKANRERESCANLHNGYCSPARSCCPCYTCGRCERCDDSF